MNRADSLRDYLTGAASDGATQNNQALSLGNYRASAEWGGLAMQIANAINNITVDYASGANDLGPNELKAVTTSMIQWSDGDPVAISNGQTVLVEARNPSKFIRVTKYTSNDLEIKTSIVTLSVPFNNIFGFSNVSKTVAAAGANLYRAIIAKNVSSVSISNFNRWIAELGTARVSDVAQLGASGSGTLTTSGSFDDWPDTGYCHIFNGSSSREIVYYSSRTTTSLNVIARALLGTSSSAGSATDSLKSVPGIAIAKDLAGVTNPGAIATIADETTAPAGVTWNRGITEATGLQIGNMDAGQQIGIWIWKHIPANMFLSLSMTDKLNSSFVR